PPRPTSTARARGSLRAAASQASSLRRSAARSMAPPAKVTGADTRPAYASLRGLEDQQHGRREPGGHGRDREEPVGHDAIVPWLGWRYVPREDGRASSSRTTA